MTRNPPTLPRASDFHPEVLRLFDQYVHGLIDRRGFLEGATRFALGGATAAGLLEALSPRFAWAQKVAGNDPRLKAEFVEFDSPQGYGKARGYLVRPASAAGNASVKLPTVLVVHENRGLNPHIEDVTRRLALEGFVAFAPDALFPLGGYPGDEDKARELFPKLDQSKTVEDFVTAARRLRADANGNGRLGVVGFCYGGSMSNLLATRLPELAAAVPFYGGAAPLDRVGAIKAKLLLHFASNDERINAQWPPYRDTLEVAGVSFEAFTYPNTQHGFNNDTTPRFDPAAAALAWERTVAFFRRLLTA
jgi:carboxymethylenebutenolidase